jgi:hypothetical protein
MGILRMLKRLVALLVGVGGVWSQFAGLCVEGSRLKKSYADSTDGYQFLY